jgi:hypothetical protein
MRLLYCADFLNHRKGGVVFYQVLLLSLLSEGTVETVTVRGCVRLKKYKSQGKAEEVTLNSKEENS